MTHTYSYNDNHRQGQSHTQQPSLTYTDSNKDNHRQRLSHRQSYYQIRTQTHTYNNTIVKKKCDTNNNNLRQRNMKATLTQIKRAIQTTTDRELHR